MTKTIHVPDIVCDSCASAISKAVSANAAVTAVEVNVDHKTVTVTYDAEKTTEEALRSLIEAAGFSPV